MIDNNINPKTGKTLYYKDNPEAVKKRDALRMFVNGKEVSKKHALYKAGRYKSFGDAAFASLQKDQQISEGYVYAIVNDAWPEWVKIGKAVDAEDRLNGYQTSSPMRDYRLVHSVYFEDRHKAEREAHHTAETYGGRQRQGEWFKITSQQAITILDNLDEQRHTPKEEIQEAPRQANFNF